MRRCMSLAAAAALAGAVTLAPQPAPGVEAAAALLAGAERPAIMAGSGLYWGHGEEQLRALAEALGIPVFLNGLGRGCLAADHELAFSRARGAGLKGADVALVDPFTRRTDVDGVAPTTVTRPPGTSRVAVFTWECRDGFVEKAMLGGADGYLSKSLPASELVAAVSETDSPSQLSPLVSHSTCTSMRSTSRPLSVKSTVCLTRRPRRRRSRSRGGRSAGGRAWRGAPLPCPAGAARRRGS